MYFVFSSSPWTFTILLSMTISAAVGTSGSIPGSALAEASDVDLLIVDK